MTIIRSRWWLSTVFLTLGVSCAEAGSRQLKLWYEEPASQWVEALPVGSGRLGAMVFGGASEAVTRYCSTSC